MSAAGQAFPFVAPVEDILFSLTHVARAGDLPGWDADEAADILVHFGAFAEGVMAPLNAPGDRVGARLENGRVRMPEGFAEAYAQLAEGGWQGLTVPQAFGGMAASPLTAAGVSEIFSGANHAMQMVLGLVPGAVRTLMRFGTARQQARWIPMLASGAVLSTMCLTETEAGSDLSNIRCRATKDGDSWRISGEKIFISGGDQDMSAGILHLVLARSGDADSGLGGLSLFLCEAQPGIRVLRIEDKLGLHASPTCQMQFDDAGAELVGVEGAGLQAMFTLMNHARIDVALQGTAHAARACHIASSHAGTRRQGRTPEGTPALLCDHADVRRMLDEQRILTTGARAMCHITLVELERGGQPDLGEFLTSLCKIIGSEAGIRSADLGIQILGGYGYLEDYGIAQVWRDARITAIYEGANGIHSRSLVTRGLRDGGGAWEFPDLVGSLAGGDPDTMQALADWTSLARRLSGMSDPCSHARIFTDRTARVFELAVWRRIEEVADAHPDSADLCRLADVVRGV